MYVKISSNGLPSDALTVILFAYVKLPRKMLAVAYCIKTSGTVVMESKLDFLHGHQHSI